MKFLTLLLFAKALLSASAPFFEELKELDGETISQSPQVECESVEKHTIQGVILYESDHPPPKECAAITYVKIYDFEPPSPQVKLEQLVGSILIGQPVTQERLKEAECAIRSYYLERGRPLVVVTIPSQNITNGVLKIQVKETRIGTINYKGNKWVKTKQLARQNHLEKGGVLDANQMQKDLIWLNRNPFRESYVVLNPGIEDGTTDIDFITKDMRPYRIFVGVDNKGIEQTGEERFFTGIKLGNLFNCDQRLSYQYTASMRWGKFFAHTGEYLIPLPWRHLLNFYGGYSTIDADVPFTTMSSSGRSWQVSMRYIYPLASHGQYNHEVKWGADYKQTDVNLLFDAIPLLGNTATITQLALAYLGSYENSYLNLSFTAEGFFSPGEIVAHQSKDDYQSLRPYAQANYLYMRFAMLPIFNIPHGPQLVTRGEFQVASRNLLSSEQFGLGGMNTVRGYEERILNTDNAGLLSLEVRTPQMRVFTKNTRRRVYENFQLLAFLDYGLGANHQPIPGEKNFRYLLGTGLGARYHYSYNVSARADFGYPLHKDIGNGVRQDKRRFNFSVIVSF